MQIRAFTTDDYQTIANIENSVYPDYSDTAEELRFYDGAREKHHHFGRFIAENSSGTALGSARFSQSAERYHPQKFYLDIHVMPENQGKGVGRGLLEHSIQHLETLNALTVRCQTRDDFKQSLKFIQDAGFVEEYRAWESRLDVSACDVTPFLHLEEQLKLEGIELKSYADLVGTPDLDRELYLLDLDASRDMPDPEPFTETTFERFQTRALKNPEFVPEAFLVAVKTSQDLQLEFLSESTLWWTVGDSEADNGATGTRREWRGKQIALALKVKNILWAKTQGIKEIKTWNDDINHPMLSINEKLGFAKQPAWVHFVRHFERNS